MEEFQLWEVVKGDLGGLSEEKKSIMHSFLSFQYFLMHSIVMYLDNQKDCVGAALWLVRFLFLYDLGYCFLISILWG